MTDVLLDRPAEGVARLTLNRPEARNALSMNVREQLAAHFTALGEDATARLAIASELGHGRIAISDAYLGKSLAHARATAPAAGDEAVAPPAA